MASHKRNLYEAFSSTLFVDECGANTKLQAFQEVESMFKQEIEVLYDMVKSTVPDAKAEALLLKVNNLRNISKTMGGLIKNIVGEIDNTREQMFLLLESYAALEIEKDPKQF